MIIFLFTMNKESNLSHISGIKFFSYWKFNFILFKYKKVLKFNKNFEVYLGGVTLICRKVFMCYIYFHFGLDLNILKEKRR